MFSLCYLQRKLYISTKEQFLIAVRYQLKFIMQGRFFFQDRRCSNTLCGTYKATPSRGIVFFCLTKSWTRDFFSENSVFLCGGIGKWRTQNTEKNIFCIKFVHYVLLHWLNHCFACYLGSVIMTVIPHKKMFPLGSMQQKKDFCLRTWR